MHDLTWEKFWKLTVLEKTDERRNRAIMRKCVCDCWNECLAKWSSLIAWTKKSCWCLWWVKTHWLKHNPLYSIWDCMRRRCYNKNHKDYKDYWWRGILIEWNNIQEFVNDMYDSYMEHYNIYWKDTTIDRIDNNWNYCKENCRWVTMKEQCKNRRNTIVYEKDWVKYYSLWEICKLANISEWTLRSRINHWMNIEEALSKPLVYVCKKWKPSVDIV